MISYYKSSTTSTNVNMPSPICVIRVSHLTLRLRCDLIWSVGCCWTVFWEMGVGRLVQFTYQPCFRSRNHNQRSSTTVCITDVVQNSISMERHSSRLSLVPFLIVLTAISIGRLTYIGVQRIWFVINIRMSANKIDVQTRLASSVASTGLCRNFAAIVSIFYLRIIQLGLLLDKKCNLLCRPIQSCLGLREPQPETPHFLLQLQMSGLEPVSFPLTYARSTSRCCGRAICVGRIGLGFLVHLVLSAYFAKARWV